MIAWIILRIVALVQGSWRVLRIGIRSSYKGVIGLGVNSRCSCERVTVDVLQSDGTTLPVVGCRAALEAYARAGQAHRRADAAYDHSSRVKGQVRDLSEPKTVQEMFNSQDNPDQAAEPVPQLNGKFRPGQPTR